MLGELKRAGRLGEIYRMRQSIICMFGYEKWGINERKPVVEHEINEIKIYYQVRN